MQELQTLLASAEQRAERAIAASAARVAASAALEANTEAEAEKQGGGQAAKVAGKDQLTALTTAAAAAAATKPGAEYQAQEHGEDKGESDEEDEEEEVSLSAEESRAWDRKDLFRWLENRQQGEFCDAIIEAFDKTNFDSAEWVDTLVGEPFALCSPSPVATRALLLITAGVLRVLSPWPEFQQMQLG